MAGAREGSGVKARGRARVVRPNRAQLSWGLVDPEAWLPGDHMARLVWAFVETLDLKALYDGVKARDGEPGRPPADPAVQLALWLLATIEGVGSGRASWIASPSAISPIAGYHAGRADQHSRARRLPRRACGGARLASEHKPGGVHGRGLGHCR